MSVAADQGAGSRESLSNTLEHKNKSRLTVELATKGPVRSKRLLPEPSGGAIATYQVHPTRKRKRVESRQKALDKVDSMRRPDNDQIKPTARRRRGNLSGRRRRGRLTRTRRIGKLNKRRQRERLQPNVCAYNSRRSESQSYKQSSSVEKVTGQI
jgi:hypothetical protein